MSERTGRSGAPAGSALIDVRLGGIIVGDDAGGGRLLVDRPGSHHGRIGHVLVLSHGRPLPGCWAGHPGHARSDTRYWPPPASTSAVAPRFGARDRKSTRLNSSH